MTLRGMSPIRILQLCARDVNREISILLLPVPTSNAPYIPISEERGFTARMDKSLFVVAPYEGHAYGLYIRGNQTLNVLPFPGVL